MTEHILQNYIVQILHIPTNRTGSTPNDTLSQGSKIQNAQADKDYKGPLHSLATQHQIVFTMMSLHIKSQFAKKRGIGKKLEEHEDLVAGDFHGAAWRRPCGSDRRLTSILEEAFTDTNLLVPPGSTPLRGPGAVPGEWADVCVFIKPPDSHMARSVSPTTPWSLGEGSKLPP